MKINYIFIILLLVTSNISAQTISYSVADPGDAACYPLSGNTETLNKTGVSGGRNIFSYYDAVNDVLYEIKYNTSSSRWEIIIAGDVGFYNTSSSTPNPPLAPSGGNGWNSLPCNANNLRLDITLPIKLIKFEAKTVASKNQLMWSSASEVNSKQFDIERSGDGMIFTKIGMVKTVGKPAQYSFIDNTPLNEINYYRLKQIDNDATFEYSEVISAVVKSKNKQFIRIFPTLTEGIVSIMNHDIDKSTLMVFNSVGQMVLSSKSSNKVDLSQMPSGMYLIQLQSGDDKIIEKVFKK